MPSWVAPPAARSAAVAVPFWIFFTSPALIVVGPGTRQTLASYVSIQTVPDTTESTGHFFSGFAPCAPAVLARSSTRAADTVITCVTVLMTLLLSIETSLKHSLVIKRFPGGRDRSHKCIGSRCGR